MEKLVFVDLGSSSALCAYKVGQTKALRLFDSEKQEHSKGSKDENLSANQVLLIRGLPLHSIRVWMDGWYWWQLNLAFPFEGSKRDKKLFATRQFALVKKADISTIMSKEIIKWP